MKFAVEKIIENLGDFAESSATNKIIRRTVNGEASPSELNFLSNAIDNAGDADGILEMTDVVDFAADKITSVGETVSDGFDIALDILSGIFDFF
ncbi:MAG: hypothetical protein Q4G69_11585 [Planctomycetia bacterium]|nr:hypothetical protein [Planctomycetia bacterium]